MKGEVRPAHLNCRLSREGKKGMTRQQEVRYVNEVRGVRHWYMPSSTRRCRRMIYQREKSNMRKTENARTTRDMGGKEHCDPVSKGVIAKGRTKRDNHMFSGRTQKPGIMWNRRQTRGSRTRNREYSRIWGGGKRVRHT